MKARTCLKHWSLKSTRPSSVMCLHTAVYVCVCAWCLPLSQIKSRHTSAATAADKMLTNNLPSWSCQKPLIWYYFLLTIKAKSSSSEFMEEENQQKRRARALFTNTCFIGLQHFRARLLKRSHDMYLALIASWPFENAYYLNQIWYKRSSRLNTSPPGTGSFLLTIRNQLAVWQQS